MSKVTLYDENGNALGLVAYTDNLDHWDGHNMTCGATGRHLGVGKLKDGRFYVCHGTNWQGEKNHAELISEEEAKSLVLSHRADMYQEIFGEEPPVLD
ncbi:MAG: hypothetical protein JW984_16200 [Deltaproteobacteria bacterium]|uniref:Uncharacterized protein n=1 Tax=Candidatus Zymogenus saltonus TaxID=2844893 RepID=A0A9D8KJ91_9DELT|nr:hypothetical protein [Candidatus Zymogenus saltonus]